MEDKFLGKYFTIPVIAAFGTMILLYIIGFIAQIDFLKFKITSSSTEIALLPIFIGLIVAVIVERLLKSKLQQ